MAKADLDRQSASMPLSGVVKDALIRHYGSLEAAAITFGMDQGQLTRELQTGDFKLKRLADDPVALAAVANAMQDAYGTLVTPKVRAQQGLREIRQRVDELSQYLELIA